MKFEEQFPSLTLENVRTWQDDGTYELLCLKDIQKYCLDKQKVKDAIKNLLIEYQEDEHMSSWNDYLLKELGLNDD